MKKIKKDKAFDRSYRPVVLWLDDLTELFETLKADDEKAEITTEDYRFATIAEFKEHFGSQTQFQIEIGGVDPYVRIELTRLSVRVHVSPGPRSAQLFHDIDNILTRFKRKLAFSYTFWVMVPFLMVVWGSKFVSSDVGGTISLLGLPFSCWFLWVGFVMLRRRAVIKLQRRSEARPFLERNKDQLWMLLIGAVLGIFVAFAGVVLKERVYPSAPTVTAPTHP